jgi:hypothetical protein
MASTKKLISTVAPCALAGLVSSAGVIAAERTTVEAFSPDIHLGHSNGAVADEDSAYISGGGLGMANLGVLPDSADVDAVHGLPSGDVLFSLDTFIVLGGALYRPSDVIRFNGSSWSKEFDGFSAGIPAGVNVDAIAMSGGDLLLSLDIDAELGSTVYSDADVITYDGAVFSIFLDATGAGIAKSADVDALHIDSQGRVLLSLDGSGEVGGIFYSDEDLLAWASLNWSMEFDGSADDAAWQPADLDAWTLVFIDDILFSNGFESE